MNRTELVVPDRLALLPTPVASSCLTTAVRAAREPLPHVAILRAAQPVADNSARWDTTPVRELIDEAMRRFGHAPPEADAWLAPRLHATLRMTRAEAARQELWNFLALAAAPDYVFWRHRAKGDAEDGKVNATRFVGLHYRQAFSRLWWAAEMFRNGSDYRPAEVACSNQDMLNTALSLDAIDHRPTALAMVEVLRGFTDSGVGRLGDRVNALCTAVNTAGSTLMYEVIAPDHAPDQDGLLDWIDELPDAPAVPWDRLPEGPDDGTVRPASIARLAGMFAQFAADAPLRDRGRRAPADQEG